MITVAKGVKRYVVIPVEVMTGLEFNTIYGANIPYQQVINVRGFVIAFDVPHSGFYKVYTGEGIAPLVFTNLPDAMSSIYMTAVELVKKKRRKEKTREAGIIEFNSFKRGQFVEPSLQWGHGQECGDYVGLVLSSSDIVVSVMWLSNQKIYSYAPRELRKALTRNVLSDLKFLSRAEIAQIEKTTNLRMPCEQIPLLP